ncbi:MAG: hypothetical protein AB1894_04965 [Chloroflexota bacterium]
MKYPYNRQTTPPIPVIEVFLSLPGESQKVGPLPGFIDTGADGTLIPASYLEQIHAAFVDEAMLRSQWGEWRPAVLYLLDIEVGGQTLPGIYVVGDELGDEIILGRNILNRLRLLLDGPAAMTQLLTTGKVK